jgi:hypothetical protein
MGNPGLIGRANPRIEIDDPEQVKDIQIRLACWFVNHEGVDAGTRENRKEVPKDVLDPIRVVFEMCGLRFDAGELAKVAEEAPHELDAETRALLGGLVKERPCPKKHKQCADCKQCACAKVRVTRDQRTGKDLCKSCRTTRHGNK